MNARTLGFFLFLAIALIAVACPVLAEEEKVSSNAPTAIRADEMHYDEKANTVLAIGNVEIEQNGRLVMADRILYEQDKNLVTADGHVIIVEPDGKVFFSKHMVLEDDLSTGTVNALKARFPNNAIMAANSGQKLSETVSKFQKVIFTPCNCDKDNPNSSPMWQLRANTMKVNDDEQKITYKDAWFDVYGVPAIYTPYFSQPTPDAPQQSGFLAPTYANITNLGFVARVPYYINFNEDLDATVTPIFTTEEGTVLAGEVRHVLENGYFQFDGSITQPTNRDIDGYVVPATRGHINGFGIFNLENNWDWGFAGERTTDSTYMQRYEFSGDTRLTSRVYIEKLQDRDFISIEGLAFQDLEENATSVQTPYVLPSAQAHFESEEGYNGSRFIWDSSTANIYRTEGTKSSRLTSTGLWHIPYISDGGNLFDLTAQLRGDGYVVQDDINPATVGMADQQTFNGVTGRAIPQIQADWRYPLVNNTSNGRISFEPITSFVASPNGGNSFKIPNEDSQEIDLSDLNIFDPNRFSGYDRVESGPRVNYGFKSGVYGEDRGSVNFLLGQSYRTDTSYTYPLYTGFNGNFSDYVGRVVLSDDKYFNVTYRFRLAEDNLTFNRNEIGTGINLNPVHFDINYVSAKRDPSSEDFISTAVSKDDEEVFATASWNISPNWALSGNARRDLAEGANGWISTGLGLVFKNECVTVNSILNKTYTIDEDIQPSTSFIVKVTLTGLSGTNAPTPTKAQPETAPTN